MAQVETGEIGRARHLQFQRLSYLRMLGFIQGQQVALFSQESGM